MHLYTPILQSKEGEFGALAKLLFEEKSQLIPLVQLLPDAKDDRKKDYVSERSKLLIAAWSFTNNRIYIDSKNLAGSQIGVARKFLSALKEGGLYIIPVVYVDSPNEILELVRGYASNGICLRVTGQNMSPKAIDDAITKMIAFYSINASEIDLIMDFGVVSPSNEIHYYNSFESIFERVKQIKAVRKLIIAAGSFPENLGGVPKDSITPIRRIEWQLWERIKQFVSNKIQLVYADYGNVHPIYDLDQSERRGTCSIKYTDENDFYILKGVRSQDSPLGNKQYQVKAADLITKSFYAGNTFSWGDQYIEDCAESRETSGNSTTWVKVTQNHHFVKILRLLK